MIFRYIFWVFVYTSPGTLVILGWAPPPSSTLPAAYRLSQTILLSRRQITSVQGFFDRFSLVWVEAGYFPNFVFECYLEPGATGRIKSEKMYN